MELESFAGVFSMDFLPSMTGCCAGGSREVNEQGVRIDRRNRYVSSGDVRTWAVASGLAALYLPWTCGPEGYHKRFERLNCANNQFSYTLRIVNDGPEVAEAAVLSDQLPAGVSFISASDGCVVADGIVTCDIGPLAVGQYVKKNITAWR